MIDLEYWKEQFPELSEKEIIELAEALELDEKEDSVLK